jgi:hypothetical protein
MSPLTTNDPLSELPELPAKKASDHINTPVVYEPIHDIFHQNDVSHKKKGFFSLFTKKRGMASISPPQKNKRKLKLKFPWTKNTPHSNKAKVASNRRPSRVSQTKKDPTHTKSEVNKPTSKETEPMYADLQHPSTKPAPEVSEKGQEPIYAKLTTINVAYCFPIFSRISEDFVKR